MEGMKAKSIKKRMKDKSFARQVSRENVMKCEEIDVQFSDFATIAIKAMATVADQIGLSN
jgi:predicted hydrolase (HD superfamily)